MLELRAVDEGAVPASAPVTSRLFVLPVAARRWVLTDNTFWHAQWDSDEVEVVRADDSSEVSLADMNAWDAEGQEPISGMALEDCDRIEATKNGLRLVLSTGLI